MPQRRQRVEVAVRFPICHQKSRPRDEDDLPISYGGKFSTESSEARDDGSEDHEARWMSHVPPFVCHAPATSRV